MGLEPAPATDDTDSVPIPLVIEAVIEMYEEWEMIEHNRTDLPEAEATAYQEGLLTAMRAINSHAGISIQSMEPKARRRVGVEQTTSRFDESPEPSTCPECGRQRIFEMGSDDPICPACETG